MDWIEVRAEILEVNSRQISNVWEACVTTKSWLEDMLKSPSKFLTKRKE